MLAFCFLIANWSQLPAWTGVARWDIAFVAFCSLRKQLTAAGRRRTGAKQGPNASGPETPEPSAVPEGGWAGPPCHLRLAEREKPAFQIWRGDSHSGLRLDGTYVQVGWCNYGQPIVQDSLGCQCHLSTLKSLSHWNILIDHAMFTTSSNNGSNVSRWQERHTRRNWFEI